MSLTQQRFQVMAGLDPAIHAFPVTTLGQKWLTMPVSAGEAKQSIFFHPAP